MMRVITGSARGRRLETLPGEDVTRPTTESVKEALFSMIQFDIEGRRVLDLFAGSGQLGIEALSRGARSCTFVENNRAAKQVLPALVPRLSDDAMVVCESGRDEELPVQVGSFVLDRERRHGKTKIALYLRGKDLAE